MFLIFLIQQFSNILSHCEDEGQEMFVEGAMKTIEVVSCIRFVETDDDQPAIDQIRLD